MKRFILLILLAASAAFGSMPDSAFYAQWETHFAADTGSWQYDSTWDCMDLGWVQMTGVYSALYAHGYSGDTAYLAKAGRGLAELKKSVRTNPRGEPGFLSANSRFFNSASGFTGVELGGESFKMLEGYAKFAAQVLHEPKASPALTAQAQHYLEFVRDTLWVKWNRDWWYQSDDFNLIHPNAGVYRYPDYDEFDPNPSIKCQTSQYNKQHDAGRVNLYLWKATGDSTYWHKARRQVVNFISKCRLMGSGRSYYEWNYGDPAGPYDSQCESKSWIEHRTGYSRLTTDFVVECYAAGIAVDEHEINRFIKTVVTRMWNRDIEQPQFALNNGNGMSSDNSPLAGFAGFNDSLEQAAKNWMLQDTRNYHKTRNMIHLLYFKKLIHNAVVPARMHDWIPPKHISCTALSPDTIRIVFSEPMDPVSCTVPANWFISHGTEVVAVAISADSTTVTLATTPIMDRTMRWIIPEITDAAGNTYFNHAYQRPEFVPVATSGITPDVMNRKYTSGPVMVTPNPVRGTAVITASGPVEIYDANGRVVFHSISVGTNNHSPALTWNGLDLMGASVPNGTYYVRSGTTVQRIMIIK